MKKTIIGSIAIVAIAAVAAFNVQLNTTDNKLSNISLANVEALAKTDTPNENQDKGVATVTITLLGRESSGCVEGVIFTCDAYFIDCIGTGKMQCERTILLCNCSQTRCYSV